MKVAPLKWQNGHSCWPLQNQATRWSFPIENVGEIRKKLALRIWPIGFYFMAKPSPCLHRVNSAHELTFKLRKSIFKEKCCKFRFWRMFLFWIMFIFWPMFWFWPFSIQADVFILVTVYILTNVFILTDEFILADLFNFAIF